MTCRDCGKETKEDNQGNQYPYCFPCLRKRKTYPNQSTEKKTYFDKKDSSVQIRRLSLLKTSVDLAQLRNEKLTDEELIKRAEKLEKWVTNEKE